MMDFQNSLGRLSHMINELPREAQSTCRRYLGNEWNDTQSQKTESLIKEAVENNTKSLRGLTDDILQSFSRDMEEAERLLSEAEKLLSGR